MATQLEKIKPRLSIAIADTSQDALLSQLIEDAQMQILDYTNRTAILPTMEGLERELVLSYYNQSGDEGIASRGQGGVSVSYITYIPESIKARLNNFRRLKVSTYAIEES